MKVSKLLFFVLGTFAFSSLFAPNASHAQQSSGGSISRGSTQVGGQINPGSGQLDGSVITKSRMVDGYIDLGMRHLGGNINGRSGNLSGQVDYGNGLLRGRINGQEFVLDIDSLKNQIRQSHFEQSPNNRDRTSQIIGIVNAIIKSRREQNQPASPQGTFPGNSTAPVPDENFGPVLETEGAEDDSTTDFPVPPEPLQTIYVSNETSQKVKFHLKTGDSDWIPISMNAGDELELDANKKLTIKYKSDSTYKYSLSPENAYRFKDSQGDIKFFSYERELKKLPKNDKQTSEKKLSQEK